MNTEWHDTSINIPVLWNGDVYMIDNTIRAQKLLKYVVSNNSWSDYAIPCGKSGYLEYKQVHALTTYRSKLLLIDERNKVWEFDANKSTFKPSLDITLPERWKAKVAAAASEGDYLIVFRQVEDTSMTSVSIFNGITSTWMIRDGPHFQHMSTFQVVIHGQSIFLMERISHYDYGVINIYKASLHSLVNDESDVWKVLRSTLPILSHLVSNLTVVGNLLCISSCDHKDCCTRLWCYLVDCESWLELGNTTNIYPRGMFFRIIGLPDCSLLMFEQHFSDFKPMYRLKPGEPWS